MAAILFRQYYFSLSIAEGALNKLHRIWEQQGYEIHKGGFEHSLEYSVMKFGVGFFNKIPYFHKIKINLIL